MPRGSLALTNKAASIENVEAAGFAAPAVAHITRVPISTRVPLSRRSRHGIIEATAPRHAERAQVLFVSCETAADFRHIL